MFLKNIQKSKLNGRYVIKIFFASPIYFLKYTQLYMKFITGKREMAVIMCWHRVFIYPCNRR